MDLELFVTDGVGDASYLVASGGEAALVDPQRDAWRFLRVAEARGWRVVAVLETHVHNDYLSGAMEARAAVGAEIVAPARGGYEFPHRPADEGETVRVGELVLTALATPGHTPEHIAWSVGREGVAAPEAVFSGGSLLVGSAGRTDLLGPERLDELTADQYRTLRRLGSLPDGVRILPTHGAGSFCSAGPTAASRTSTLGEERAANPALNAVDETAFRDRLLGAVGRWPAYYEHMAPINRAGPWVMGRLVLPSGLNPGALGHLAAFETFVVDARSRTAFAAGHVPGSLNVELNDSFAAYVGWVVPFNAPIVLVLPEPVGSALEEAVTQLFRIGYDRIAGFLDGGYPAWEGSGRAVSGYPVTTMEAVFEAATHGRAAETRLLDVRQPVEWRDDGAIPGSTTIFVADLADRLGELPRDRPVTVLCRSGGRASLAASILDRAGYDVRLVDGGGAVGWPARFAALDRPG